MVSQIARALFGTGLFYYLVQISTMLILILAANTSFADFPRLSSLLSRDRYAPRQFAKLGDRLVFSNGILILGGLAALLLIALPWRDPRAHSALRGRRVPLVHAVAKRA